MNRRNASGGCSAASISSVASSAASSRSSWGPGGVIKKPKQPDGVRNARRKEKEDQKCANPAGRADYQSAQMIWTKLENPQTNDKFNPLGDFSSAAVDLARLGKRAMSLLPLSKDMDGGKAKRSIRPHNRMCKRLGDSPEEDITLGQSLAAYQENCGW